MIANDFKREEMRRGKLRAQQFRANQYCVTPERVRPIVEVGGNVRAVYCAPLPAHHLRLPRDDHLCAIFFQGIESQ